MKIWWKIKIKGKERNLLRRLRQQEEKKAGNVYVAQET
jgi:hypothetical protein